MSEATPANLAGWIPPLASDDEIRLALEKAFDYRGDVTFTLKDGRRIEGYIFDRRSDGPTLDQCAVRLLPAEGDTKITIGYGDIARVEFSPRDPAAGKSFQTWLAKYRERTQGKME
jgi:hypothetical protein